MGSGTIRGKERDNREREGLCGDRQDWSGRAAVTCKETATSAELHRSCSHVARGMGVAVSVGCQHAGSAVALECQHAGSAVALVSARWVSTSAES